MPVSPWASNSPTSICAFARVWSASWKSWAAKSRNDLENVNRSGPGRADVGLVAPDAGRLARFVDRTEREEAPRERDAIAEGCTCARIRRLHVGELRPFRRLALEDVGRAGALRGRVTLVSANAGRLARLTGCGDDQRVAVE